MWPDSLLASLLVEVHQWQGGFWRSSSKVTGGRLRPPQDETFRDWGVPLTESRNYGTDFLKPGCGFSSLSCEWPPLEEGPYPADVEIRCHLSRVWCWLLPH